MGNLARLKTPTPPQPTKAFEDWKQTSNKDLPPADTIDKALGNLPRATSEQQKPRFLPAQPSTTEAKMEKKRTGNYKGFGPRLDRDKLRKELIEYGRQGLRASDVAKIYGIGQNAVYVRLQKAGLTIDTLDGVKKTSLTPDPEDKGAVSQQPKPRTGTEVADHFGGKKPLASDVNPSLSSKPSSDMLQPVASLKDRAAKLSSMALDLGAEAEALQAELSKPAPKADDALVLKMRRYVDMVAKLSQAADLEGLVDKRTIVFMPRITVGDIREAVALIKELDKE